jgi:hypothetical protein
MYYYLFPVSDISVSKERTKKQLATEKILEPCPALACPVL